MMRKTYYLLLGVPRTESLRGIRKAFRELAQRYHPDHAGPRYQGLFQQIVEAYRVLADPDRRKHYDQGLLHADPGSGSLLAPVFVDAGAEDGMLVPEVPLPLRVELHRVNFDAAMARVAVPMTEVGAPGQCEALEVQIVLPPEQAAKGGMGFFSIPSCSPCWECGGSGSKERAPCPLCDGEGLIAEEEVVALRIPPMIGDGTRMELPLRGLGAHNFYLRARIRIGAG